MKKTLIFEVLIVLGAIWLGCYCVKQSKELFGRWNLLLDGHVWCKLVVPGSVKTIPAEFPRGSVGAMLVYQGREYIGYVNNCGDFVALGSDGGDPYRYTKRMAALAWIQLASLSGMVLWAGVSLWSLSRAKKRQ